MSHEFYVYRINLPDGTPVYIGKGKRNRMFNHISELRKNKHSNPDLQEFWNDYKEQLMFVKIKDGLTETEALVLERKEILRVGRDALANRTDGGEGTSGCALSAETKARMSEFQKARLTIPSEREKVRNAAISRWKDPEAREIARAKATTPEALERLSVIHAKAKTPEGRLLASIKAKKQFESSEARAELSTRKKAWWARKRAEQPA